MRLRVAAFFAFFVSGASSLVFQSIWSRMLHHVFGATGVALSTVVTAFMAGLGLGAYVAGRWADRVKNPLVAYAWVEFLVGLWALLVPWLVSPEGWLADVNRYLRDELGAESMSFMVVRFFCVVPILIIPTTLMGSSLPLLARQFVRRGQSSEGTGASVGSLYSVNTLGAVAGVLLAGFVLMPRVGVFATNVVAVCMNLALGTVLIAFRKPLLSGLVDSGETVSWLPQLDPKTPPDEPSATKDSGSGQPVSPHARWMALVVFSISGAAALCYEVVWSRALAMTIGSSVYSFSLILSTFLVGIAGGSALAATALDRIHRLTWGVGFAAVALVGLGLAPWAASRDLWTAAGVGALCCVPIVVVLGASRLPQRLFTRQSFRNSETTLLVMLVGPLAAAGLSYGTQGGRVAPIVGLVVVSICVLTAVLVVFRRYVILQISLVQLFIAASTFLNYLYQDEIPCAFASMVVGVDDLPQRVGLVQFLMFACSSLCTLPATMAMGAMFPLTLRVWTRGGSAVGRDVGTVYSGNTLGSIVGAWLPGFVLMPWIGMERTLHVGIVINLVLSLAMLLTTSSRTQATSHEETTSRSDSDSRRETKAAPVWYTALVYLLAPIIPALVAALHLSTRSPSSSLRWNQTQMTLGVFRVSLADDACGDSWGEPEILFYHDGLSTTVTVERWGDHLALKNNGKVDASNGDDMPTQVMVAGFPLLFHPKPAEELDVAVVGFGSGVTIGSALAFAPKSVDVVELERSIPRAARLFASVNQLQFRSRDFPYVEMPGLRLINDDGRNYLASTRKRYDVVISEPSNPWITGVSDLFTTDHFRITKRRLRAGGIYCQWVQLYELSPEHIKTIYRTFAAHFRYVRVFAAETFSSDTVLLGSDHPLPLDRARLAKNMKPAAVREELARAEVYDPYDVFARSLFHSRNEVDQYVQIESRFEEGRWVPRPESPNGPHISCTRACRRSPAPLNTDDNALIEFAAPKDLIGYERYEGYTETLYAPDWPYGRVRRVKHMGSGKDAAENYARLAQALIAHGRKQEAAEAIAQSRRFGVVRLNRMMLEVLTLLTSGAGEPTVTFEEPAPGPDLATSDAQKLQRGFHAARVSVDAGAYESALVALDEIPAPVRHHSGPAIQFLHAYLLSKTAQTAPSRHQEVIDELEDLVAEYPEYVEAHPEVHYYLARSLDTQQEYVDALHSMKRFVLPKLP